MKELKVVMVAVSSVAVAFAALVALALVSCGADPEKPEFSIVENSGIIPVDSGGPDRDFRLDYRFEYISRAADDEVMHKIQAAQSIDFFGAEFLRTDVLESARAFDEAIAGEYDWGGFLKIRSWADVLADRVVAFTIERAEYAGGAHGMETTEYANYDLRTGERLSLDDVFSPEGKAVLADAIRAAILKDHGADNWEELVAGSCYNAEEGIMPTENFLLSERYITFVYNPYDIACYAQGATKVRLPLAGLAGFRTEVLVK